MDKRPRRQSENPNLSRHGGILKDALSEAFHDFIA